MFKGNETDPIAKRLAEAWEDEILRALRFTEAQSSARFMDSSGSTFGTTPFDGDHTEFYRAGINYELSIESIPIVSINLLHKVAALLFDRPQFLVTLVSQASPDIADVPAEILRAFWEKGYCMRTVERTLYKTLFCGMGFVCVYWDNAKQTPVWEAVSSRDLVFDPRATNPCYMKWAARRVWLNRSKAEERFPEVDFTNAEDRDRYNINQRSENDEEAEVEIWNYWNVEDGVEAFIHNGKDIEVNELLYGRVPIWVLECDVNPESPIGVGDHHWAIPMETQYNNLFEQLLSDAAGGGPITLIDPKAFNPKDLDRLKRGKPEGPIPVKDFSSMNPEEVIHRVPAQQLSPGLLPALGSVAGHIDAAQATTQYSRGVVTNPANTATEAVIVQNLQGARAQQFKVKLEKFVEAMCQETLRLWGEFGVAETDVEAIAQEALLSIQTVKVVEDSMIFQDPTQNFNTSAMLLQTGMQLLGMGVPVNLQLIFEDMLKASGKRDTEAYFLPPQMPSVAPPSAEGGEGGGNAPLAQQQYPPSGEGDLVQ